MYKTTRKDQRDAIRALIAADGFASGPGQREDELEKMLMAALDELDLHEGLGSQQAKDFARAWSILSFRQGVESERGEKMSLQELSAHFETSATELTRLLKMVESKN